MSLLPWGHNCEIQTRTPFPVSREDFHEQMEETQPFMELCRLLKLSFEFYLSLNNRKYPFPPDTGNLKNKIKSPKTTSLFLPAIITSFFVTFDATYLFNFDAGAQVWSDQHPSRQEYGILHCRPVVLKPECTSESLGGLIKTQIIGPHLGC